MQGSAVEKMLSEGELKVFKFIRDNAVDNQLHMSMKKIGKELNISEATVHRAIRKLKKSGIIGISASQEKAESNTIIFYGLPDAEEETNEIFDMIARLNQRANRFKTLLEQKDDEIERLRSQLKVAEDKLKALSEGSNDVVIKTDNRVITSKDIISVTDLGGGTIAYITRVQ